MSLASRQRDRARRHLALRRGHPTWEAFRAWQRVTLAAWVEPPDAAIERAGALVRDAWGRVSVPPRLFSTAFDPASQVPLTFPEVVVSAMDTETLVESPDLDASQPPAQLLAA